MMTFIDLTFSPSGQPPFTVVAKLQRIPGVTSVMGNHDVMFRWQTNAQFDEKIRAVHHALRETGATYRVFTVEDSYQSLEPVSWVPPVEAEPELAQHPAVMDRRESRGE